MAAPATSAAEISAENPAARALRRRLLLNM
jgi:hypothetical protein